ncbi:hypothetical protein M569_07684, partial [Genlisea aurea]
MESPDRDPPVSMEFPANDGVFSCSPPTIPSWLRRRLSGPKTPSPTTVQEIEAKLREADLRRQKFYASLSSKARTKPRSPSRSPSNDDPGQRLEAKLMAAEEKRLSILSTSQMRLAKLHELRRSAKIQAEMRFKRERTELGTKVELRFRNAEANRMLLLRAYRQRRENLKERVSQSIMRRVARESKYKERVHAAIYQKRINAEKKRLGLLEAERRRAQLRFFQVQKAASSISLQREAERSEMKNKIESKLERAGRNRAEFLQQRGRQCNALFYCWEPMNVQAESLAIKLSRCWRNFKTFKKTTASLAKTFHDLYINGESVKSMPFEQFALLIQSNTIIQTLKTLLDRLEFRHKLSRCRSNHTDCDDIDHLLRRVASPKKKKASEKMTNYSKNKKTVSTRKNDKHSLCLSRYQVRIVLCAYMIFGHPDAVVSGHGERETALVKSAEKFVKEFDLLIKILLNGPLKVSDEVADGVVSAYRTIRLQLVSFDSAWCSFLNSFVVWKAKDAKSLEEDLIKVACRLELSMIQTCKLTREGHSARLSHDMQAIKGQVFSDQKLLREKVLHLSGTAGIERLENALSDTRAKYFNAKENGFPITPLTPLMLSSVTVSSSSPSNSDEASIQARVFQKPSSAVRSLFSSESNFSASSSANRESLDVENARIVNEYAHGTSLSFSDGCSLASEHPSSVLGKVRDTMEKAFWDGIIESVSQDDPDYRRVVDLMAEVRDGICSLAPHNWREEICEEIDLEILTQVLNSGDLDITYLAKILEYALNMLRKLSASAYEAELMKKHQKFMEELSDACARDTYGNSNVVALIKGLSYVLRGLQELKQEISKARIRMLEPFLKGPEALYFLEKAFTSRYGHPSNASTALPLTAKWFSSARKVKDEEWSEFKNSTSESKGKSWSSSDFLPSTALRTGGSSLVKTSGSQPSAVSTSTSTSTSGTYIETIDPNLECKGDEIDVTVRLGLLKLVTDISGLTEAELPETMVLNLYRLRSVQAQMQKIIVIATSLLVLRQTLLSERIVNNQAEMDGMLTTSGKRLSKCLDIVPDAGISEIIESLISVMEEKEKVEVMKEIMGRMVGKSLQEEDGVFRRVSRAVYVACRGVVLGGRGRHGREVAERALQKIGVASLVEEVMDAAHVVAVAAKVSVIVHGSWYAALS